MLIGDIVECPAREHPGRIALRFEDEALTSAGPRDRARRRSPRSSPASRGGPRTGPGLPRNVAGKVPERDLRARHHEPQEVS
ncbi:hypothetical protein [Actinomadura sediminis]|uniref:Uncharacterized protein n=1 Tax=Actinomadura sediminis TaxID=1038904 RepID=A0ABW3EQ03_9ACTN